jgi:hypothetical protein
MPRKPKKTVRDRIKAFRRIRAGDLVANPLNWRVHPKAQEQALRDVLAEIGYADAVIARELPDGALELVDGHLRAGIDPEQQVPVLVVDLDDAEAAKLLAVLDPLSSMAEADPAKLRELLDQIETGSEDLAGLLTTLAESAGIVPADTAKTAVTAAADRHTVTIWYDDAELPALKRFLGVRKLPEKLAPAIRARIFER